MRASGRMIGSASRPRATSASRVHACSAATVDVRKRHAQQFVVLVAAVEVLDQLRHAFLAAHRRPEMHAGILEQRFPAVAQLPVIRDRHGTLVPHVDLAYLRIVSIPMTSNPPNSYAFRNR